MNKSTVITLGVLVAAAAGGYYYYTSSATAPKDKPAAAKKEAKAPAEKKLYVPSAIGKVAPDAWLQPEKVQEAIGPKITAALASATPEQVAEFLKKPENRLMVAQWMLAQDLITSKADVEKNQANYASNLENCTNAVNDIKSKIKGKPSPRQAFNLERAEYNLMEATAESKCPHTVDEILKAKNGKALLKGITNNPDWLEQIVFTGEANNVAKTLGILTAISKKYPQFAKNTMSRDIATATAAEYGRYNWNTDRAVKRYNYFNTHYKNGDLNTVFDGLPFWHRRIVCGAKGDNDFCSLESFEWANENVKLPAEKYSGACWRCGYKLRNPYGESIHGSLFGAPFDERYGRNRMWFTYEVGGVCGSLSHFGAYSACANGIPALTAGEPGHCAFVLLVGDKWTPSYSLSWERGLHWQVFANVHVYSSLHMATDLFRQKSATAQSNTYRVLAGELARQGKNTEAVAAYGQAVTLQPNNFYAWREYAQCLKANSAQDGAAWCKLNELVCQKLAPTYPEMAAVILADHVYAGLKEAVGPDSKKLTEAMMLLWGNVKVMGPDRWRIEQHITKQLQALGIGEKDAAQVIPFAGRLIKQLSSAPEYLPVAFSWTNGTADKFEKQEDKQKLLQASIRSLSGMGSASDGDRVKILAPLVLAAEKSRDMKTFQSIRKMFPADYGKSGIPQFEPFPGKLMSQGGLVFASSTCNHDAPCEHPFLLEPTGGRYHSAKDKDPWVAVELTKQTNVSGIVVVLTQHNMQRCYDVHVQISETGKDDDWHDVALEAKPGRVIRVDLQGKNPLAKYVRVLRAGGPEFFHLNGIYVYGKPAA